MLLRGLIVAMVFGASVASAASKLSPDSEKLLAQGNTYYFKKQYREALKAYETVYVQAKLSSLLYGMAQCHKQLGEPEQALARLEQYRKALPRAPNRAAVDDQIRELRAGLEMKATPSAAVAAAAPVESVATPASQPEAQIAPEPALVPVSDENKAKPKAKAPAHEIVAAPVTEIPLAPADPAYEPVIQGPALVPIKRFSVGARVGAYVPTAGLQPNYDVGVYFALVPLRWLRGQFDAGFVLVRGAGGFTRAGLGNGDYHQNTAMVPLLLGVTIDFSALFELDWPVRPVAGVQGGVALMTHEVSIYSRTDSGLLLRPIVAGWVGVEVPVYDEWCIVGDVCFLEARASALDFSPTGAVGQATLAGVSVRVGGGYRF